MKEVQHQNRSHENIRIENRRKTNKETWDSERMGKRRSKIFFARKHEACFYCGDPSEVAHHETDVHPTAITRISVISFTLCDPRLAHIGHNGVVPSKDGNRVTILQIELEQSETGEVC